MEEDVKEDEDVKEQDEEDDEDDEEDEEDKTRRRRRDEAEYLPATVKSEIKTIMAIGAGSFGAAAVLGKRRPRNPARRTNQNLPLRR